jgi:RNA polymerase sigma-70 factor (ECF subfamily)
MDAAALFAEHHASLFRYLSRMTGEADIAADAAQEAFVRLMDRPPRESTHTRAWLFKVGINLAREALRTSGKRQRLLEATPERAPIADAVPLPDAELEKKEKRRRVHGALQQLPERDRTILLMREEGFSHREIAEAVGTTTGSVGTLIARALNRLARELRLDEEDAA